MYIWLHCFHNFSYKHRHQIFLNNRVAMLLNICTYCLIYNQLKNSFAYTYTCVLLTAYKVLENHYSELTVNYRSHVSIVEDILKDNDT